MSITISTKQTVAYSDLWAALPPDVPVLFWDACGLLDALRLASRFNKSYADNFRYVAQLIRGGDLVSVIPALVPLEFQDNCDEILAEAEKRQRELFENLRQLSECSARCNEFADNITALETLDVAAESKNIVEAILSNSYQVEQHDDFKEFAHFRVVSHMAPAKNKQEYKDCYIWGCVTKCANSRPDKARPVFYVSSNRNDYCTADSQHKILDAQIEADCHANNINFFFSVNELRGHLKKSEI